MTGATPYASVPIERDLISDCPDASAPRGRVSAARDATGTTEALRAYFGLADGSLAAAARPDLSEEEGFFTFRGIVCFGRCSGVTPAPYVDGDLPDVSGEARHVNGRVELPFDLESVVRNLRQERYRQKSHDRVESVVGGAVFRSLYYALRPLLSVGVRRHLQRLRLSGWSRIPFPAWPVDVSIERLMRESLACALEGQGETRVPFIWFWPDGAPAAAIMTHDVEGRSGRDFCPQLMAIDDEFDIPAAFQIIPDGRCGEASDLFELVQSRGFEVNVHDLSHDGSLFADRSRFVEKAALINQYAERFGSRGFRAGSMYRQQDWFDAFGFSYDMSVPNVAHLEPQRGGCCTVMPYFIGDVLELPLTTTQDYSLFHILGDYSTSLWQHQIELILREHGLISFIAHPDYLDEPRAVRVYRDLLERLTDLRSSQNVWIARPGDVDWWWRRRRDMRLAVDGTGWRITGIGNERARIAYASLRDGQVAFEVCR